MNIDLVVLFWVCAAILAVLVLIPWEGIIDWIDDHLPYDDCCK